MPKRRTIYYDDARHFYLWNFEPPMDLRDAWVPVDQVAGTAVDTFVYGVSRDDGLFYDTKASTMFGSNRDSFNGNYEWRAFQCLSSLVERGLSPLKVLIDRAHDKDMEFIASLRLGAYASMPKQWSTREGGQGWVHAEVRDHLMGIVRELATDYPTDGVELDFAAPPGGSSHCLREEDRQEHGHVIPEFLEKAADIIRNRPDSAGTIGARVYPTEQINRDAGYDVRAWLQDGLVDYVAPLVYAHNLLDADMPIEWLIEAAHDAGASVYPILMPYYNNEQRHYHVREFATPQMTRAAVANYWDKGCDGMYAWFMRWPLGDPERRTLSELGDPDLVAEGDKHYVVNRRTNYTELVGFERPLPQEILGADPDKQYAVPFYIADDPSQGRVTKVVLRIHFSGLVSEDRLTLKLNGQTLSGETCYRSRGHTFFPYNQWWDIHLSEILPVRGSNLLELSLDERPPKLAGKVQIVDVEIVVEHSAYPTRL